MNEQQLKEYEKLANRMAGNVVTISVAHKNPQGVWLESDEQLDLDDVCMAIDALVEEVRRLQAVAAGDEVMV